MSHRIPGGLSAAKRAAHWLAPRSYEALRQWRFDLRQGHSFREKARVHHAFMSDRKLVVRDGPFTGMVYVEQPVGSALWPKIVGSYEAELHTLIERIIAMRPSRIINIGSGEGYYAVGLARRIPEAHVFAFEMDPAGRALCEDMARVNGVASRVVVEGECTLDRLSALVETGSVVICDCEGCEVDLLAPDLIPKLKSATLLVELHDFVYPHAARDVQARFAATHDLSLIDSVPRDPAHFRVPAGLSLNEQRMVVDERRPGIMQWAFMTPKV